MKLFARRSRGRLLRPVFEWILLAASLVAGLSIIGACGFSGASAAGSMALGILGALPFAIVLVGAVYLLTSMSRDLRGLRKQYVDDVATSAPQMDAAVAASVTRVDAVVSGESTRADT
jgi:hypothetical protein